MLEKAVFFRAVSDILQLPKNNSEVIFSGRSNVGKSSIINVLCGQKNLARTSKTPGRTRSLNVYSISMGKWLIDLPGYGFARVSPQEKVLWKKMIEDCIVKRKSKKSVYVIIDAFVGPTELDFNMTDWLIENGINFKIVANKSDKLPNAVTKKEIQQKTAELFDIEDDTVFPVSAKKKDGFSGLKIDVINFLGGKR
jgi:GTP-binding protein